MENLKQGKASILFIEEVLREMKIKSPVSEELFEKEIIEKEDYSCQGKSL